MVNSRLVIKLIFPLISDKIVYDMIWIWSYWCHMYSNYIHILIYGLNSYDGWHFEFSRFILNVQQWNSARVITSVKQTNFYSMIVIPPIKIALCCIMLFYWIFFIVFCPFTCATCRGQRWKIIISRTIAQGVALPARLLMFWVTGTVSCLETSKCEALWCSG